MAYYEMMPAGLPAGLQSGMDSVLNKKFGTATSYAPGTWPDDVNLMGPLPEKTIVSSPIADFSDGADDVPTKSLVVTIPASLSGVSSVTETQTGRNLFDKTTATIGKYINVNGQEATNGIKAHSALLPLKPSTTYYMSGHADASYYTILALDKDMNVLSTWYGGASKTEPFVATTPNNAKWCYLNFNADQIDNVIFAESTTAIPYEPYNGTTYTANLGRTIYGGTPDIVNGTGKEICGKIVFDGSETRWAEYATGNGYAIPLTGMKRGTWYTSPLALSSPLPKVPNNDNLGVRIGVNNDGIYVVQANTISGVTDLASFKAWLSENPLTIIYPLDTEIDFTFDGQEINTRLGYNAFWSDEGDTEVTYRADISLALQAVSGLRGLMMARTQLEPETEPEETIEETPEEMER